ncbi:phosphatidate cytidylyltransferase [Arcanobacterium pluranimalium]|uniref:phosphatidate cytidylyltransferase n=1 Tax=Arcanobacterium pluranimalium TaxID=108028 RepID=UPI00195C61C7|nr:phosphatidate cytidylyltransferase [Arcanobacterium pluranimalium]MBM7825652.1 phosphatidate cytidylyltransferase [Arcanobacterium pluranimalium]
MSQFYDAGQTSTIWSRFAPHPPKPPVESHSRAGRNLPAAIATAVILLSLVALSLVFRLELFLVLVIVFLTIGMWEITGAFMARNIRIPLIALSIGQLVTLLGTWFFGIGVGLLLFLFATGIAMLWGLGQANGVDRNFKDAIAGSFALAWIGLSGCFAVGLADFPHARALLISLILLPVANDTGGWLAGILFGKHPIAPKISPKKSWEGFIGSLLLSLLVAWLTVGIGAGLSAGWVVAFGVITPIIATAGDFSESMLKRDLGIKDMGSIFPGHGGMLDRLDSLLFCAPTFYFLFSIGLGTL